ncbi:MAG: class I SAM-dependent methyltransferase [Candidatus Omnitrophica bacterium]|nr:class I SAM-dependent methyltransferase [Candidatus Omnitrophota bacterium]
MKNIFDQHWRRYDAWYEKHRFAYLSEVEAIKNVLPKKGKGLEIGVGTGRFASALGISDGIDPSIKMAKVAKGRGINVKIGNGEALPYKDGEFDFSLIAITICFVEEPEKVISEANRALKDKGKIILAIVDKDSFLGKFYQQKKSTFYKEANFFSVKEAATLLREAGFNKFSFHQTIFNLPEEVKTIQIPIKGYGKGGFVVISGYKRS